eukprot:Protomagalhaensia_sp_Gyna_25__5087@NODE_580_length_3073_cov_23_794001_g437_i1_p2_GENE_NODE_580_length_3073_cov_23_794001_g437_i1NODE_580_length_3073_cov_23_794001_g437_i1_p2_ORF_typecomplete_len244_score42_62TBP/PF00352_21/1_7e18TBP/PF00352_21/4_8e22DUF3378/PF11858_8/0_17DUF3378/PF11858_8/1_3e03_NODE_580_length_3073_cov_23_794001_g437_i14181149
MDFDDFGAGGDDAEFVPEENPFDLDGAGGTSDNALALNEAAAVPSSANATSTALEITDDYIYPSVSLKNMICSAHLKTEIDLRLINIKCRNVEWNPRRVNAALIRLYDPKLTCTLYANGKVTICGATNVDDAKMGAKIVTRLAQKAGHPEAKCASFKIETIMCSAACGFPVRLENLAKDHNRYCNYEPETFCGLVYRYQLTSELKASILVFVSGRLIITGCKSREAAEGVFRNLYALLYQYRA